MSTMHKLNSICMVENMALFVLYRTNTVELMHWKYGLSLSRHSKQVTNGMALLSFQCFDAVGWAAGRASSL